MSIIPIEYSRRNGVGKELTIAHTLSASDWRGLNRNQSQNAVLEIYDDRKESVTITDKTQVNVDITKPFTYVSLFSGIGGFETALNRLGGKCVMASEIDKYANKAYEILYGMPTAGDITKIAAEYVPDHDLLTAGFPCQAFSVAGKRLGFEDTRGTLFFEVARIAKVKRPKIVLLENVKGLVSHDKGRTLDTIIQTLCDIGYTVDFNVLNSKYFGVPQNRERIFIIGVFDGETAEWHPRGNDVVAKGKRRIAKLDGVRTFNFDWPPQTEVTTRLRDVLEENVDERFYLSEEKTAKLVTQLESHQEIDSDGLQMLGKIEGINGHEQRKKVYSVNGVSPTPSGLGIGGNTEPKIAEVANDENLSHCIDANYTKGISTGGIGKGRRTHIEETTPRYRIRKLTPLECFRLQGFPDEYHAKLTAANVSNSQLYKMVGNAVTVNVIEAIGRRLLDLLA